VPANQSKETLIVDKVIAVSVVAPLTSQRVREDPEWRMVFDREPSSWHAAYCLAVVVEDEVAFVSRRVVEGCKQFWRQQEHLLGAVKLEQQVVQVVKVDC
jgi:hypothetical protein